MSEPDLTKDGVKQLSDFTAKLLLLKTKPKQFNWSGFCLMCSTAASSQGSILDSGNHGFSKTYHALSTP